MEADNLLASKSIIFDLDTGMGIPEIEVTGLTIEEVRFRVELQRKTVSSPTRKRLFMVVVMTTMTVNVNGNDADDGEEDGC